MTFSNDLPHIYLISAPYSEKNEIFEQQKMSNEFTKEQIAEFKDAFEVSQSES